MRTELYDWDDLPTDRRQQRSTGIAASALKGAIAGMAGGAAMKMEQSALLSEEERMDPPPKKLIATVAQKHAVEISQTQAMAAGMGVHMGYSALWGAIYGIVQDRLHPPEVLHGLLLGGLVYAANFPEWGLLPRVGALPPPSVQEPVQAAIPMVAHAVFGLTTAKVFEALH